MVDRAEHEKEEDLEVVDCSHGEGSRPQCAGGGRRSPEALVESVSRGSCEASLGHSGLQPRCIEAQALAQAQAAALAHSGWLRTPAHRQSVQTLDAAGRCGYNQSSRGVTLVWEGVTTVPSPKSILSFLLAY
jgi:hypothetical protein